MTRTNRDDFNENVKWLSDIGYHYNDILIVAGDVSEKCEILLNTLENFRKKFKFVFFIPGNHDVWLKEKTHSDSWEKMQWIVKECKGIDVQTSPQKIELPSNKGKTSSLWIVPIYSWHHKSFDTEPDLTEIIVPDVENVMSDYRHCKWPHGWDAKTDDLARNFDELNDDFLINRGADDFVISFSHFVPRLDLNPEKRYLFYPKLPGSIGSNYLRARVAELTPNIHVFGHTHFAWDSTLDGIRYIQAPLSYPSERVTRLRSLTMKDFPFKSSIPWIFDTDTRSFAPDFNAHWSKHYLSHKRNPDNLEPASWVRAIHQK
eukprot:GHVL01036417.1.p1 GENE.GHVL01036417.1~~GHVL01036417.1.p1  ORF type:complete len:317 (+),score=45.92 GHVL01036417.1:98-1048(+)